MSNTVVVNCKRDPFDVYIGRGGIWGNPFKIGTHGDREQVIALYRRWILDQPQLLNRIKELKGKKLGCFCKPQSCHGDILATLADNNDD